MKKYELRQQLSQAMMKARVDAGKSQCDMAKLLNVSYQTVQNWEYGDANPPFIQVYKWFEALNLCMYKYLASDTDLVDAITIAAASLNPKCQLQICDLLNDEKGEEIIEYVDQGRKRFYHEE